jgi:hypothetical protein
MRGLSPRLSKEINMNVLTSALAWASRGYCVFPVKPYTKEPAFTNWQTLATTDENQIREWFEHNDYNLGIPTGSANELIAIDIDIKGDKDGIKSLTERFGEQFLLPENSLLVKTANDGLHIIIDWTDKPTLKNGTNILGLDGIDIRGEGGLIIGAGSKLGTSKKPRLYRANKLSLPFAEINGWIEQLLTEFQQSNNRSAFDPTSAMNGIAEGSRNDTLFRYACHLRAYNFDIGVVIGFISQAAKLCTPPFPEDEAKLVIENAFAYQPTHTKQVTTPKTLEELL